MRPKRLNFVSTAIAVVLLASSCAKTGYDGSLRPKAENKMAPPVQGRQQGTPDQGGSLPSSKMPVISFTETQVLMSSKLEAKLELQLSEPSNVPVVARVDLLDMTARHNRDFNGFKTHSRNNETQQTIIFAPGETRKALPPVGGIVRYASTTRRCNSDFVARIDAWKLQNARVINDRSNISVPCFEYAEQPLPPVAPPPVNPLPVEPPAPVVELPLAAFERDQVVAEPSVETALARIVLNKAAEQAVFIDIETQGVTGAAPGYAPLKERYMIAPGQASKDIPIKIVRDDICNHPITAPGVVVSAEFNIVVTDISGAKMAERTARLIVKDDNSRCKAPVVNPPQPPPPPPAPVLPKARFERKKIEVDLKKGQVVERILLDKIADQDVVIELETRDGLAKENIDYVPVKKTVTIKAGESKIDVPISFVPQSCRQPADGRNPKEDEKDFSINVLSITNAEMKDRSSKIEIDEDVPLCKPVVISASFESKDLKNERGSTDLTAKINLDKATRETVVFDIETQEGSAKQDADFVRIAQQLSIAPGATSISIPLKLIKKDGCVDAADANKQFNLVVSNMKNAVMAEPVATISVVDDRPVCAPAPVTPPPAPVSPAPAPPVTPPPAPVTPDPAPPVTPPPAPVTPDPAPPVTPPPAPVTPDPAPPVTPPPAPPVKSPPPVKPAPKSPAPKKAS